MCEIFNQISLLEKKAEQQRIQLCRRSAFNPYVSYKRLDEDNHNKVTPVQLQQFLRDNDMLAQDCDIFYRLALGVDIMTYQDYLNIILPRSDQQLREVTALKQPQLGPIDGSVENALAQLFYMEVSEYANLERLKIRITKLYSINDLFDCIDTLNNGVLSYKDIDRFFRRNGLLIYEDELLRIFTRVDQHRTGTITSCQFKELLTPVYEPIQILPTPKRTLPNAGRIVSLKNGQIGQSGQTILTGQTSPHHRSQSQQSQQYQSYQPFRSSQQFTADTSITTDISEQYEKYLMSVDNQFIELMITILKMELYMEEIKVELAHQQDFNAMDAFHFIDVKGVGKVDRHDVGKFFKKLNIRSPVDMLFRHFDRDNDGYIRFSDFNDLVTPITYSKPKKPRNSSLMLPMNKLFNDKTIHLLKKLFSLWLNNEESIGKSVGRLRLNFGQIFDQIDTNRIGAFTLQDVLNQIYVSYNNSLLNNIQIVM